MNNWQPIETAPKDRRILLMYEDQSITSEYHKEHDLFLNDVQEIIMMMDKKQSLPVNYFPIAWIELPEFGRVPEKT